MTGEWGGGMGDMDGDNWIPRERLRDSPELRVWKKRKRIRSDDGQTDGQTNRQTEFPLVDSTPSKGRG